MNELIHYLTNIERLAWAIPLGPLGGTILAALLAFHPKQGIRKVAHWPVIVGLVIALIASVLTSAYLGKIPETILVLEGYTFIGIKDFQIRWGLYIDSLATVMLLLVNGIGLLVTIYSVGYMKDDEGYARYFAILGLFVFSMSMLVLVDNYLVLYVFWEGVGLCSYLLIGHWYEKPTASAAARKAFLVNRIGDAALFIGIILLYRELGSGRFGSVFYLAGTLNPERLTLIGVLLLAGACAKSAQFPLHVWLPDAMEGPTPVSALIHAATMVTAGVYLVARSVALFALSVTASCAVLVVGTLTAFLGAILALTQYDLKRVLAYSTISQLGVMFMGLGAMCLKSELAAIAAAAVIFHLVSHGLFKALLFLCAGNIMHATGGVIDLRMLGGLRKSLPYTHLSFVIGALALAGIPPLAGFFSKDAILAVFAQTGSGQMAGASLIMTTIFVLVGALTAFYISRAYLLTFWGEEQSMGQVHPRPHEAPWIMLIPVMLLAFGSLIAGILLEPTGYFRNYIHLSQPFGQLPGRETEHSPWGWITVSVILAMTAMGLAFWLYPAQRQYTEEPLTKLGVLYTWSAAKFFIDEIYNLIFVRLAEASAWLSGWLDRILDAIVDLVGWSTWFLGRVFRPMQNGQVQFYALAIILGIAIFSLVLVSRWGG
ncbi:MAG: NADH-quinone oxidoreductase subunit L [Gemmatales bacterium]|nr:NADH-quinone oxidoreductase subunit L [Gemmatales bacterium]MDW7993385.1 NADH-quinone oxidoreductase subunit L [Gemmatales bacterium]